MSVELWQQCVEILRDELSSQLFNTWIRPLQVEMRGDELRVYAPNRFVVDFVNERYLTRLLDLMHEYGGRVPPVQLLVGSRRVVAPPQDASEINTQPSLPLSIPNDFSNAVISTAPPVPKFSSNLNVHFTFENFVEGKSNQLAHAAAKQVAENPRHGYNPLFLYGGVGLGKTHLMHAVGNHLQSRNPAAKIFYLHSERFVSDMIKALQSGGIEDFKQFYRSVDALLIDDIQFFARKERSQEEFFHTFNVLVESGKQIILTSDRYPKEIEGLDERLKSRLGWGLTVAVEPPDLETRIAILLRKAEQARMTLPDDVARFIAQRVRSNVRELEGVLKRIIAHAHFTGSPISIPLVRESLRDLLALQDKLVSIDNIQRTVAEFYKLKLTDLLSKSRVRKLARPRQVAMALSKELTSHSLPEIGAAFGGRDHTTVLHACRKVRALRDSEPAIRDDYRSLLNLLNT